MMGPDPVMTRFGHEPFDLWAATTLAMSWQTALTEWQLQRVASGRLAYTPNRKDACEILVKERLLDLKSECKDPTKGREREEYRVNSIVFQIRPAVDVETPPGERPFDQAG